MNHLACYAYPPSAAGILVHQCSELSPEHVVANFQKWATYLSTFGSASDIEVLLTAAELAHFWVLLRQEGGAIQACE